MPRLAIYGYGGMGRELKQAARAWDGEIVFVSDREADHGPDCIGPDRLTADDRVCVAVGDPAVRRGIVGNGVGLVFATIVAPTALIDPSATIGEGAMICDFSMINSNARIGRHFLCNYYSHVSHDCVIGDFVTFSPRVSCCGTVTIGDGVFIGAGAVIRNGSAGRPLRIGEGAFVGMGAVVTEDVEAGARILA